MQLPLCFITVIYYKHGSLIFLFYIAGKDKWIFATLIIFSTVSVICFKRFSIKSSYNIVFYYTMYLFHMRSFWITKNYSIICSSLWIFNVKFSHSIKNLFLYTYNLFKYMIKICSLKKNKITILLFDFSVI